MTDTDNAVPAVEAEMSENIYTLECRAIDCEYKARVNSDAIAREARAVHEEAHPEHNVWILKDVVAPETVEEQEWTRVGEDERWAHWRHRGDEPWMRRKHDVPIGQEFGRAEVPDECFWCAEPKDDPIHSGKISGVEREGTDGLGAVMDSPHKYLPLSDGARIVSAALTRLRRKLADIDKDLEWEGIHG